MAFKISRRKLLRTFRELVALRAPSRRERPVADYIKYRLGDRWPLSEDDAGRHIGGDAGNILVRINGAGEPLLFAVHMDTVEPCDGVKAKVRGGYVVSAGDTVLGADDRAAVAVLLELSEAAEKINGRRPVELLFTVAEEVGLLGAKNADYTAIESRTAFVFDASEPPGVAVTAAPGSELVTATFHGRAAHAGIEPEKGASAIQMAAAATAAMRLGRIDHETTANIGVIEGGQAVNIVPARAVLRGEVRSHDPAKLAAHVAQITGALQKAAADFGGEVEIKWERVYRNYRLVDTSAPAAHFARAAVEVGLRAQFVAAGGGSDANVFNARGIRALVVGCGMENAHTCEERIAVASLYKLAELATALATA